MLSVARKSLIAVTLVTGLVAVVWFSFRERHLATLHSQALAATEAGDVTLACEKWERYLASRSGDADAHLQYALVRQQLPLANHSHLVMASNALQKATELEPSNMTAWLAYGDCCNALGAHDAALLAARQAFHLDETNIEAVLALASQQYSVGSFQDAVDLLSTYEEAYPEHRCNWKLAVLDLTAQARILGPKDLQALLQNKLQHVTEAEQRLYLEAYGNYLLDNHKATREAIRAYFERSNENVNVLRSVIELCDRYGEPELAVEALQGNSEVLSDPFISLWFARRCWQLGKPNLITNEFVGRQIAPAIKGEIGFLLHAARQASLENFSVLELAKGNAPESCWDRLAELTSSKATEFATTEAEPAMVIDACEAILELNPSSPVPPFLSLLSYFRLGEYQVAGEYAARLASEYPFWFQVKQLRTAALLLSGRPEAARSSVLDTLQRFPDNANVVLSLYNVEAVRLGAENTQEAESLLKRLQQVQIPEGDPREFDLALIQAKALLVLDDAARAEQLIAPWGTLQDLNALERERILRNLEPAGVGRVAANAKTAEVPGSSARYANTLRRLTQLTSQADVSQAELEHLLAELESFSPGRAILWRLAKAKWLLRDSSEKSSARVVRLLGPLARVKGGLADAHLLIGVALARLHDESSAAEHFLIASRQMPVQTTQVLRLTMGLRREGEWHDAVLLAQLWNALPTNGVASSASDQVVDRMILLAEFAEQAEDLKLAEATYRKLLKLEPELHFANNNLANVLLKLNADLEEALHLAKQARRSASENTDYKSTVREIRLAIESAPESL